MTEYTCEFCNSKFSTKSNLNLHIKINKTCLKLRGGNTSDTIKCNSCDKIFTTIHTLNRHTSICKVSLNDTITKLTKELESKNKYIKELEEENKSLKRQSNSISNSYNKTAINSNNTINRNIIINYLEKVEPVNLNNLKSDDLSPLLFKDPKNFKNDYASYILKNTDLKNKLITNNSLSCLTYKEGDNIVNDKDGKTIVEKTFILLKDKILDMINSIIDKLVSLEKKPYIDNYIIELKDLILKINTDKFKSSLSKNIISQSLRVNELEQILKQYSEDQPDVEKYVTFVKKELDNIEEAFLTLLQYRESLIDVTEEKIKSKKKYKLQQKLKDSLEQARVFYETQQTIIDNNIRAELEEKEEQISLKEHEEQKYQDYLKNLKVKHSINKTGFNVKNEENKVKYTDKNGNLNPFINSKEDRYRDFNLYNDSESD